jgi:hypothetical protein
LILVTQLMTPGPLEQVVQPPAEFVRLLASHLVHPFLARLEAAHYSALQPSGLRTSPDVIKCSYTKRCKEGSNNANDNVHQDRRRHAWLWSRSVPLLHNRYVGYNSI